MEITCPQCNGTGKYKRKGNRWAHVCHACNGDGVLPVIGMDSVPLFDIYAPVTVGGMMMLAHHDSWTTTLSTMRGLRLLQGVTGIYQESSEE